MSSFVFIVFSSFLPRDFHPFLYMNLNLHLVFLPFSSLVHSFFLHSFPSIISLSFFPSSLIFPSVSLLPCFLLFILLYSPPSFLLSPPLRSFNLFIFLLPGKPERKEPRPVAVYQRPATQEPTLMICSSAHTNQSLSSS